MRLWIDGGGLHSAPRCLSAEGVPTDALDLLHLALQLVFAETLLIGTFRDPTFAGKSQRAVGALVGCGCEPEWFEVVDFSSERLEEIYIDAGDELGPQLTQAMDAFIPSTISHRLESSVQKSEDRFDEVIRQALSRGARADLRQEVLEQDNNGLLLMLAATPRGMRSVRWFSGRQSGLLSIPPRLRHSAECIFTTHVLDNVTRRTLQIGAAPKQ
jgi:hypothetical protein